MGLSLRNKFFIPTFLLFFVFFLEQCSNKSEQQSAEKIVGDSASCTKKPVNPNGDSELSVLMRTMLHSSESMKELIKKGDLPKEFPEAFLKIHSAKPTDSETKKASFDGFANNYIDNLHALYNSPKADLTKHYNALITACANCHTDHCPGPLKAINKLKI